MLELHHRRRVGGKLSALLVEHELEHLVGAEMRHEHEAVRVVGADRVRVARRRDHLDRFADLAVLADRVYAHLVGAIGGAEQEAAGAVDRDVRITFRERTLADEFQRARGLVDGIGVGLERLGAHSGDEEALVRAYRHRHHDLCGRDARAWLQRTVRLQRVHPDLAVLGVGDVNESPCNSRLSPGKRQHDCNDRRFHVLFLPRRSHNIGKSGSFAIVCCGAWARCWH